MALTIIKNQDGELIANKTYSTDEGIRLDIFITDDKLSDSLYKKHYLLSPDLSEENFHKTIRKNLDNSEEFIQRLSTNPEWTSAN